LVKKKTIKYADGINFYLYKHPEVKPALLTHFEPWSFALDRREHWSYSTADLTTGELKSFTLEMKIVSYIEREKTCKPVLMVLLWLHKQLQEMPLHQSPYYFYFRPEIQMSSEEGLNAYGAVTWGNFSYIKDLMKIVDGCILLLM
jgi:hypothetical protein